MVTFCAEIASNHNADLSRALRLMSQAQEAGFEAVKFQLFTVDELFCREALQAKPELEQRRGWELPLCWLPELRKGADRLKVQLGFTCFDLTSLKSAKDYADFLKISSYDILRHDLIRAAASTGKLVLLSRGLAAAEEVNAALWANPDFRGCVRVLHCVSKYPTPPTEARLARGQAYGLSDHSANAGVIHRAVHAWGMQWVELHMDDGKGWDGGPWCWTFERAAQLIRDVRDGLSADFGQETNNPDPEMNWRADPSDGLRPLKAIRGAL